MAIKDWTIKSRAFKSPLEPMDIKHIFHIDYDQYIVLPRWQKIVWKLNLLGSKKDKARKLSDVEWQCGIAAVPNPSGKYMNELWYVGKSGS